MKKILFLCIIALCGFAVQANAQIGVTMHTEGWSNIPPEAQKRGYYFQWSELAQMDDDPALEEVMLFGKDNGHYATYDLFKYYYAVVDNYTKEVEYISPTEYFSEAYSLVLEDRNNDGRSELYITYIKEGTFSTDKRGYALNGERCYERIEWQAPEQTNVQPTKRNRK